MNHIELGLHESRQANITTGWDNYVKTCTLACAPHLELDAQGKPSFDGDQRIDGYSLDWLYDQYDSGSTVAQVSHLFRQNRAQALGLHLR